MWANVLAVAAGGAVGAVLRYAMALGVRGGFPWATLAVNVSGSLLFGFLAVWLSQRLPLASGLRAFLLVGMLGAFTTFSTFSWETLALLREGLAARAGVNVLANVMLGIAATGAGVWLARQAS